MTGRSPGRSCGPSGKLAAVREWADEHDVDLDESYAYSDSAYDAPLLGAVGFPIVVNPDPRMMVIARARRWPVLNLDVSPGVVKIPIVGLELQRLAMQFTRPAFVPYARFEFDGVDNVPTAGSAIIVANHRSYFDSMAISMLIAKTGRTVRFLGKKEVFDAPVVGQLAAAMGGIRVDRGTGSDEPLKAAAEALLGGEMVTMMPQGTIPRGPAFFDPDLKGRWGAARLAQMSQRAGHPGRVVGDREGVAAFVAAPERPQPHRSACRADQRWGAGGVEVPVARRRHQADHEGDPRPAPTARPPSPTPRPRRSCD